MSRPPGRLTGGTLGGHFGGDLVGDIDRRVRGVGAACVDIDKDVVSLDQRSPTGPSGVIGFLLSRDTGVVIAGTIGGASKLEFTLIGDTVNVAARVEQLTKTTGDTILLTQQCIDALAARRSGDLTP